MNQNLNLMNGNDIVSLKIPENYVCEFCCEKYDRKGNFLNYSFINSKYRYRSMYFFDKMSVIENIREKHTRGLPDKIPATNLLIIDIDTLDEEVLDDAKSKLEELELAFKVYRSGGKGFHIEVEHQFITDMRLPFSQKSFVEKLEIEADLCIYNNSRLIRLNNTVHETTGKKKELIKFVDGNILNLELIEKKESLFKFEEQTNAEKLASAFRKASALTIKEPDGDNRHTPMWSLAKMFFEAGIKDKVFVKNILINVQTNWLKQKNLQKIDYIIDLAFRQTFAK